MVSMMGTRRGQIDLERRHELKRILLFLILVISTIQGFSKEVELIGHIGKDKFNVINAGKNILIEYQGKETKIALNGYAANQVIVKNLNGDQSDDIIFMDLGGNS